MRNHPDIEHRVTRRGVLRVRQSAGNHGDAVVRDFIDVLAHEAAAEALRMIECLKMSRLEIKDIKQFMDWCVEGASTYPLRRELLEKQKETVEAEIAHMNKVLDMLRFKCWYYDQAIQDGSEDRIKSLLPDHLPDDIQPLYDHAHQ